MPSTHPRIGITPAYKIKDVAQGIPRIDLGTLYTNAVSQAGGVPIVVVPSANHGAPEAYAATIDGLMLTGGPDLDPAHFDQEPHPERKPLAPIRDEFDIALLRAVLAAGKPVLGICLGQQQINVALGGTLHQHLPDVIEPCEVEHRWLDRENTPLPRHDVEIFDGARLAQVVGGTRVDSNSSHHQAIDRIATGLRQTAATADGVIEGVESEQGDQILAIQWHPEYLTAEPPHLALFEDLIARARRCAD